VPNVPAIGGVRRVVGVACVAAVVTGARVAATVPPAMARRGAVRRAGLGLTYRAKHRVEPQQHLPGDDRPEEGEGRGGDRDRTAAQPPVMFGP
jgi:hypothetical protein